MPQPLRRENPPIDWSTEAVANHPVLSSGVGACITSFASLEATLGVMLAMIRWEDAPTAVERWRSMTSTKRKVEVILTETALTNEGFAQWLSIELDKYEQLATRRAKLAHGFFGIITDRHNEFAWRKGGSAAQRVAKGLNMPTLEPEPISKTWKYTPQDFRDLAQECADAAELIGELIKMLPMYHAFSKPR